MTWLDLSSDDYHAHPAVGSSTLKEISLRSPAHSRVASSEQTKEMRLGTLIHMALLEEKMFFELARPAPKCDRRTLKGKADWEAFQSTLPNGAFVVAQDDFDMCQAIIEAANKSATWRGIKAEGEAEKSGFVDCGDHVRKIRPDWKRPGIIFDLKTVQGGGGAKMSSFERTILYSGYNIQAAYYLDTANMIDGPKAYDNFVWVVIEREPPYAMAFYRAHEQWLETGRQRYTDALTVYLECQKSGVWPAYPDAIQETIPPAFAMYY